MRTDRAEALRRPLERDPLAAGLAPDQLALLRRMPKAELLLTFDLPIAILQDAESLTRVSHELVEDVATDGTRYVEIRWGPALHVERGLSLRDGIAAVVAGARTGTAAVSAGGGPGIVVRLIAVALRSHAPGPSVAGAREAARFPGDGLTGFGLAGGE